VTLVVDTGVMSAVLSRRPRPRFEPLVAKAAGNPILVAPQTVAELRYGALVAGWAGPRRKRLEAAISAATVVPVSDRLLTGVAALRYACRQIAHPLVDPVHANDLWIAACAIDVGVPLLTADSVFEGVPGLELA
jgi:predicted nucleic acid-binding protein